MNSIKQETLNYLLELGKNNNKPWFEANKAKYEMAKANFIDVMVGLATEINKIEKIVDKEPKKYPSRIYRDLRFSKDKTPYNTHISALIERAPDYKKCPFYIHIMPGGSFVGGGVWQPEPDLLKKVRQEIDYNASDFHKIVEKPSFKHMLGEVQGDKLVRAPKGYEEDNPNIELLKLKNYTVHRYFTDEQVTSADFVTELVITYKEILPFLLFFDGVIAEV